MFYDITVVQASKMLGNLKVMLEKAEEFAETKKVAPEVLLSSPVLTEMNTGVA